MWALYQWQLGGQGEQDVYNQFQKLVPGEGSRLDVEYITKLVAEFLEEQRLPGEEKIDPGYFKGVDARYFRELVLSVPPLAPELDLLLAELADRPVEQIDPVERAILLIGLYELRQRIDIPYRVVINEAVELAKFYGGEDGHRYVNAILDRASQSLRELERQSRRSPG
jgi:N utilization substance protein B